MTDSIENASVYQPLRSGKQALSRQVANQILDLITAKHLTVGSRLPSIEELSEYLGVSRSSVREAIKLLDAWGAITVKHGVGTFVTNLSSESLKIQFLVTAEQNEKGVFNLHQIREALEPEIAALAAKNATEENIQEIEAIFKEMENTAGDREEHLSYDVSFHSALAQATGNNLFLFVIQPINHLLEDVKRIALKAPGGTKTGLEFHKNVIDQIKNGSPDGAKKEMQSLLEITWLVIKTRIGISDAFISSGGTNGALSEQVAHHILGLIISRQLKPGNQLPPLEEIGEQLGVSRTSVREAIKLLDAWGVITVKHGVGTFVTGLDANALALPLMISAEREEEVIVKLHQLREALEPYIAAKAAENVTPIQIEKMEGSLETMDASLDNSEEFIQADLDFHTALAEATGNDIFLIMIHPVIDLLQDVRRLSVKTRGASSRAQAYHHSIYNYVITGQPAKARDAMKSHLDQTWCEIQTNIEEK